MISGVMADDDQVEVLDPWAAERVDDMMGRFGVNQRGLSLGGADERPVCEAALIIARIPALMVSGQPGDGSTILPRSARV
jgi:hypothetical protein